MNGPWWYWIIVGLCAGFGWTVGSAVASSIIAALKRV